MDVDEVDKDSLKTQLLSGLTGSQGSELIKSCVGLLSIPADPFPNFQYLVMPEGPAISSSE